MDGSEMRARVRAQLAVDLNCSADDFDEDGLIFRTAEENPGRRPFPREPRHFEMLTMGKSVVISATHDLLPVLRAQLEGKSRDDAFTMPFVYGHSLYYLPDLSSFKRCEAPNDIGVELMERQNIPALYALPGFRNAILYDPRHLRPDMLVTLARCGGEVMGMAGASADCAALWQIGIDVLPPHRGKGIAALLVNLLAAEILDRGLIPYYGTSSANIASQRVAHRAGFMPAWMCAYRGRFGDSMTSPTS